MCTGETRARKGREGSLERERGEPAHGPRRLREVVDGLLLGDAPLDSCDEPFPEAAMPVLGSPWPPWGWGVGGGGGGVFTIDLVDGGT